MADGDPHSARELAQFAENLLQQVHDNFQALADKLTLRNMGEHIDDLEKHVNGLLTQAGVQNASEELTISVALFTGCPILLIIFTHAL